MPTTTIKSSGGTYPSVSLWESDTDVDLAGTGENIGEIYDVNTTALITIAGATNTSASDFRHLTTAAANKHAGVWDTGKSYFQVSGMCIDIGESFCRLSYIQANNTSAGSGAAIRINSVASCQILQCIGWGSTIGGLDSNAGLNINSSGSTSIVVRNSVFYGARNGIAAGNASATATIENCCTVGSTRGIFSGSGTVLTIKNCYAGGCTTDYSENGATGWTAWTATTCMCEDSITETGLTSGIAYDTSNFTNVTAGSENLHLVSGSALIGQGTDLSGSFTVDINGNTRAAPWDVGADQFVSGGAATDHNYLPLLGVG